VIRFLVLCLAGWLAAGAAGAEPPEPKPAPLTKEQQDKLKERDRYEKEANQLRSEGKLPEAIAAAAKMLALERQVFGRVHPDVAGSLQFLAELHEAQEDFAAARKARQEVLAIQTQLRGEEHWQVTDARLALERLERLARLAPADRRRLAEATRLNAQAGQLWRQGKPREGIPLAQKALEIRKQLLGERHVDYAYALSKLALLYQAQGSYAQAEPLFRQSLAIQKQVRGERHPDYANCLNDLASLYQAQGKYADAEPLFRQSLEIFKQVLGERHPAYALSLNNLAALYHVQGKYAQAEPLYRQAAAIQKQLLGERHPEYATSLNNLAELYREQGEYAQAEPLFLQALAIHKQALGERHPDYATNLNNLALLYYNQGKYAQAEPLFRQVLTIRKEVLGERHADYATSLHCLGELYRLQGEYAQAEPLLRQVVAIRKQVLGEHHPAYAIGLDNLALLYYDQGEYSKAESLSRQALAIIKQVLGERHPDYATSLQNLAAHHWNQGEDAEAEQLFRQALEIRKQVLSERHPDYAGSLSDLAGLYRDRGEYSRAETLFLQAVEIYKEALGERHPTYAQSLSNLALLYRDQNEYSKAEPLFRQALAIRKQALGERHPYYATSLCDLALLYRYQGEYAQAEPLLRQALVALRQSPEGSSPEFERLTALDLRPLPETIVCLVSYSTLFLQRLGPRPTLPQLRAADHAFALALDVRERLQHEVLEQDASKLQHGTYALDLVPRRIGLCQRLFAQEGHVSDLETALATAEQGSARVFLEQLGKARALAVGHVSQQLQAQEAALRRQLREFDTRIAKEQDKPADKRDPDKVGQLLDEQKKVEAKRDALIRRMAREYPQYAALQYPRPCSLAEARACLATNEVALLFVPGDEKSYLLLVEGQPAPGDNAHGLAIYPLPGQGDLVDGSLLLTDRDTMEGPAKVRLAGKQAYDLLLAPVKERIRGKDLVIVAGGPLGYVPFEALREDGHYLIEKHRIRYAPSLTALHLVHLWEQTRGKPERPLWALADPIYDKGDQRAQGKPDLAQASQDAMAEYLARAQRGRSAAGVRFSRLRFTGQEASAIRGLLRAADTDVLTGLQASEAAVKAASAKGLLAQARYVHFATHGILGLDTGQPPALVLSLVGNDGKRDEDGGVNDGFLRLDEVTRLQLNADLVVLSACETGRGRLYAGEGVTGLARAFLYAGSRGVVCSLWAVDDRETASFMAQLYGGLKDGQAAGDALRAAKLAMIREGKPPVYWAPFILIGE
jgi:CHAT domain-containing protein/tetratricopeptide (TPR) repeat protein